MAKKLGLTAKQVEHMKADPTRRTEIPAGPPSGLYLVLHPSGAKSWAFRYRWRGKTRKLTYRPYPEMGLAAARAESQSAVADLENNIDPARTKANEEHAQQSQLETEALHQESVARVADEFLKRGLKPKEHTRGETARVLKREITPWRQLAITDIGRPDVLRVLDEIVDRGAPVMACRTRGILMRFFKWAQGRGYIERSPIWDVPKPGPDHKDRDRVLDSSELAELWNSLPVFGYPSGRFIQFLILTAQRRGEVANMRWRDVDLEKKIWTLPKATTKPGRVHDVPLSVAAVELLSNLPRFADDDYIWTTTSGAKPINGFSKIKSRIDEEIQQRRTECGDRADDRRLDNTRS